MKLRAIVVPLLAVNLGVSLAWAAETPAKNAVRIDLDEPAANPPATPKAKAAPSATKTAPAAGTTTVTTKPATPKKDTKKKAEPPAKVEGMEIARQGGGFLGLRIENSNFKIGFYDKDRKPVVADVSEIVVRWQVNYQPNDERALLTPIGDGKVFSSAKVIRPPHSFKLIIALLKSGSDGAVEPAETYVVDFHG